MKKLMLLIVALIFISGCVKVVWTPYLEGETDQKDGKNNTPGQGLTHY